MMASEPITEYVDRIVTLRNEAVICLRAIRPDDAAALLALSRPLSPDSIYQRFFTIRSLRPEDAAALANVDDRKRVAIVADRGVDNPNRLIGVVRYAVGGDDATPDIGLVVEDSWQGQGLGSMLLNDLLQAGEARGFFTFRADVLADNRRMLRLLVRYAEILQRTTDHGVTTLLFRRLPRPLASWTRVGLHEPSPAATNGD